MGAVLAMRAVKGLALVALIGISAGCDSYEAKENAFSVAFEIFRNRGQQQPLTELPPVTRDQLDASPVGVLDMKLEDAGAVGRLLHLATNGPYVTWASVDGATITLKNGILVASRSLGNDLMSTDVVQIEQMLNDPSMPEGARVHRYLDADGHIYARTYLCAPTERRADRLFVVDRHIAVTRITQSCEGADARFENVYWREAGGKIRAARQWVSPEIGSIRLLLLKD